MLWIYFFTLVKMFTRRQKFMLHYSYMALEFKPVWAELAQQILRASLCEMRIVRKVVIAKVTTILNLNKR